MEKTTITIDIEKMTIYEDGHAWTADPGPGNSWIGQWPYGRPVLFINADTGERREFSRDEIRQHRPYFQVLDMLRKVQAKEGGYNYLNIGTNDFIKENDIVRYPQDTIVEVDWKE